MAWALAIFLAFDLAAVKTEPNLEKRSELALKNAELAMKTASDAYKAADDAKFRASLGEIRESVDLAYASLVESGKNPRNSKYYKRAELTTQQMIRRLDALRETMSVVDRDQVDPVRARVSEIHDQLLMAIMSKKK